MPRPLRGPPHRKFFVWVALTVSGLGLCALLAGLAGRWFWVCELLSHFQVQYFWCLAAATAMLACLRLYRLAAVPLAIALIPLLRIAPCYLAREERVPPPEAPRLRVMSFNVHTMNREHRSVCEYVKRKNPDVAVFYEVNEAWGNHLEELFAEEGDLRYHKAWFDPEVATHGLAVFSRWPLWEAQFEDLGDGNRALMAEILLESRPVTLIAAHTTSPKSPARLRQRNRQLARLAELSGARSEPVVLVGDLNTSLWSPAFEDLMNVSGLRDGRQGAGVQATWPSALCPLGIPIDHCLVSREFLVRRCRAGNDLYSDHLPLIVDLALLESEDLALLESEPPLE